MTPGQTRDARGPRVSVLGPVTVQDAGPALSPRDRVVLAALVVRRGREVPAETLAEALWGEALPASWPKVVQGCVARLRRRLGSEAIETGRVGYRLTLAADEVDSGRFERLVGRVRELAVLGEWDLGAYTADEALALWRGEPFPDLEEWEPGLSEASRLREQHLLVEELRVQALVASGRHQEALPEAHQRVREQPLREHRWALLARAQYQAGRQAEALATLRRARETLAEELGLDPGAELVELEQAVLRQDPGLDVASAGALSATCPWPGLASYDVDDAEGFFGRDVELRQCLERLRRTGFLAVVGASGSGKSSLVRAGLTATLRRDGRQVVLVTPGPRPLDALTALPHRDEETVLVVDQCEEALAPTVPERDRADFFTRVAEHGARGPVVVALRADRLGELTAYAEVAQRVEEGLYLLKAMGEPALREAIEEPAARAGLVLEHGLVDLLVREVEGEPGSLPLLAHALRGTWERRSGSTLTVEGYRATGGIRGAVAQTAEQVYEAVSPEQRVALREMLLRMVQPGPDGEPVRTSVSRRALASDPEQVPVLERLVRARLVTVDEDRFEIAHEALTRAWPRLQAWLADDVQGERIRHHLAAAAESWAAMGRPASELYRGARLANALEWRAAGSHRLSDQESEFLDASDVEHQSGLAQMELEATRQRRLNRRLRALVAGVAVLALLGAAVSGVALLQWNQAHDARAVAESEAARAQQEADRAGLEADRARSQELVTSAMAVIGEDPGLAKVLALMGLEGSSPTAQSLGALHAALDADRVTSRLGMYSSAVGAAAALHPEGNRVALSGADPLAPAKAVEVQDPATGELVWQHTLEDQPGQDPYVMAGVAYTPDGRLLVSGRILHPQSPLSVDPEQHPGQGDSPPDGVVGVQVWDAQTYEDRGVLDVGGCGGWPIAVSDTHALVKTIGEDSPLSELAPGVTERCDWVYATTETRLVDLATGEHRVLTSVAPFSVTSGGGALSRDGTVAAVDDGTDVALLDVPGGRELARWRSTSLLGLDPTGSRAVVSVHDEEDDSHLEVRAVPGGAVVSEYEAPPAQHGLSTFAGDGHTVLSVANGALHVWDPETGHHLRTVFAVGDGRPVASGSWALVPESAGAGPLEPPTDPGSRVALVDLGARSELWGTGACGSAVSGPATGIEVAGDTVLAARWCRDGTVGTADIEVLDVTGRRRGVLEGLASEGPMEISPDGRFVVVQTTEADPSPEDPGDAVVRSVDVVDTGSGAVVAQLEGLCAYRERDLAGDTCRPYPLEPFVFQVSSIDWSPDGRWIAAAGAVLGDDPPAAFVWDARTGDLEESLHDSQAAPGPAQIAFTSGGSALVVTYPDGAMSEWETSEWRAVSHVSALPGDWGSLVGTGADGHLALVRGVMESEQAGVYVFDQESPQGFRPIAIDDHLVPRLARISPDGTRVAVGKTTGEVSVLDLSGSLLDRPGLGRESPSQEVEVAETDLSDLEWLDASTVVVSLAGGEVVTYTSDPDRLASRARQSLTRGVSGEECERYAMEPCPVLREMRGGSPAVPESVQGTYALRWTVQELRTALTSHHELLVGGSLTDAGASSITTRAGELAGPWELVIGGQRFALRRASGEELCVGGATVQDDILRLDGERGVGCPGVHYVRAGYTLEEDGLVLDAGTFRGDRDLKVFWTTKPLDRVD